MLHVLFAVALGSATVAVSDSRCNDININTIQGKLLNFALHPASAAQQTQRGIAIVQAQNDIQQEEAVLQGVCPDSDFPPFSARLYALDAWSDLLQERNGILGGGTSCPDADKKLKAATAASAWLKLAQASLISPQPPKLVGTLVPQVQALASEAGMTLPAYPAATTYWESQYVTAAKQAIVDCAAQSPQPK